MKVLWIILGVISILAGVLALANPMAATLAAVQIAGWGFLIVGVMQIFLAFRADAQALDQRGVIAGVRRRVVVDAVQGGSVFSK